MFLLQNSLDSLPIEEFKKKFIVCFEIRARCAINHTDKRRPAAVP